MSYINSIDTILEKDENPSNEGKKSKNFKAFLAIGLMAMASAGLYMHNHNAKPFQQVDTAQATSVLDSVKSAIHSSVTNEAKTPTAILNPIYEASKLISSKNKDKLESVGQFTLPDGLKNNQIGRVVAQVKFKSGDFLAALISEGEGFTSTLTDDNIGNVIGYGLNTTMQSKAYLNSLATAISQDQTYIKSLSALGGQTINTHKEQYNMRITPQRALQISYLFTEKCENAVIKVVSKELAKDQIAIAEHKKTGKSFEKLGEELFNNLEKNEKSSLSYHTFKVGEFGLTKYTGMLTALVHYSHDKTQENAKKVAEHMTYKYKMNGEIKEDIRAEFLVQSMFMNKGLAFGYSIKNNVAPRDMAKFIPAITAHKIDTSVPDFVIPDPVGDMKEKLRKEGKQLKMSPVAPDYSNPAKFTRPINFNHRFL